MFIFYSYDIGTGKGANVTLHRTNAEVAFKDMGVWIGIKCVITSLRQAGPLCRNSGHTSRVGHKIKRADVLPKTWLYLVIGP